jgi:membrane protein YdbS with pleckstrin-like domain
MGSKSTKAERPRNWDELRRRVLEEDYFDVDELQHRKRRAHQMKYYLWLLVPILVAAASMAVSDGVDWPIVVATVLIAYGTITSYWLGVRWERRWDELIREKQAGAQM